jgi:hypothetical protein
MKHLTILISHGTHVHLLNFHGLQLTEGLIIDFPQ